MSARTASRLTRILAMVPWVIANPGTSVAAVCERFGYSERDLGSDLNILFVCGLPGYGPGDLMNAEIVDDEVVIDTADYFAKAPRLAPAEALALLAAGMAVMGSGQGTDALASAVAKLTQVLIPEGFDAVDVDLAAEPELVGLLRGAAGNGRVVAIRYTSLSRDQTTEREVEPWAVFSSLGNWYLNAYCRLAKDRRIFRIDRIQKAHETSDRFTPPADLPTPEVRYTPSVEDVMARIALGPRARWVMDYYPIDLVSDTPEELIVDFSAADPLVGGRLLLRLGADARLIDGPEVGAALEAMRARILSVYKG